MDICSGGARIQKKTFLAHHISAFHCPKEDDDEGNAYWYSADNDGASFASHLERASKSNDANQMCPLISANAAWLLSLGGAIPLRVLKPLLVVQQS